MTILRPYQQDACRMIVDHFQRFNDPALVVLPTGAGKTQVFCAIANFLLGNAPKAQVFVLAHRQTLVEQAENRLRQTLSVPVGVWCGALGRHERRQVTVATVQSTDAFEAVHLTDVALVIIDEAHNIPVDDEGRYRTFLSKLPASCKVLGVTATPFRLNGGLIHGDDRLFPRITFRVTMDELISGGYLVRPRLLGAPPECLIDLTGIRIVAGDYNQGQLDEAVADDGLLRSQIVDALPRLEGRRHVVWFCTNIDHADRLAALIGDEAVAIHSRMGTTEREAALAGFANGTYRHICNVSVLTEGWDFPAVDAIVLLRPTASAALYVQAVGRGLRPAPGKTDCLVLDYAQVVATLGFVNDPVVKTQKRGDGTGEPPAKVCPNCKEYVRLVDRACPECGYQFPEPERYFNAPAAGEILGDRSAPVTKQVTKTTYDEYHAKSGNLCIRITYHHGYADSTAEYLSFGHPFAAAKARAILNSLSVEDFSDVQTVEEALELMDREGIFCPQAIVTEPDPKNPKYTRITKRILYTPAAPTAHQITCTTCGPVVPQTFTHAGVLLGYCGTCRDVSYPLPEPIHA